MRTKSFARIIPFIILSITLLLSSCSKEEAADPADAYVGIYNVSLVQQTQWGNSSATLTDSGIMEIIKTDSDKIELRGFIRTKGNVNGNSIYLESSSSSDYAGNLTTVYNVGTLSGNVITLSAICTGQLRSDSGVLYPFKSFDSLTCIKQ